MSKIKEALQHICSAVAKIFLKNMAEVEKDGSEIHVLCHLVASELKVELSYFSFMYIV